MSVSIIDGYDPVGKHNSKTWPHFNGPTQKGNWVKVLWPDQDKKSRALGSSKKIVAQVVKFSPVCSDLEGLLNSMLAGDDIDDCNSGTAKKAVKRKGDLLEERILRRLRQELDQRCKFGSVVIPAIRMVRLENCQPSVYTQELAAMVFGVDVLAKSCLKGSSVGEGKEPLQKDAVDDIIVHMMSKFPVLTETAVRAFLRRKCNNVATALKKEAAKREERERSQQRENTN